MNGIFPDYIGVTEDDVFQSLYPDWMAVVTVEEPTEPGIGIPDPCGPSASRYYDSYTEPEEQLMAQIRREDEEILSIIVISMEVLQ